MSGRIRSAIRRAPTHHGEEKDQVDTDLAYVESRGEKQNDVDSKHGDGEMKGARS